MQPRTNVWWRKTCNRNQKKKWRVRANLCGRKWAGELENRGDRQLRVVTSPCTCCLTPLTGHADFWHISFSFMKWKMAVHNALCFYADQNKINVNYVSTVEFYKCKVFLCDKCWPFIMVHITNLDSAWCNCLYKSLVISNEKFNYYLSTARREDDKLLFAWKLVRTRSCFRISM